MAKFTRQSRWGESNIAGMYDLEERLGSGHFAEVKLARHVFTGERVAVKVIDKLKLDETAKQHLYQEVRCMKLVQHPNIVRLYEVIDTKSKLYLVQELGDGGDMYDYIMKHEGGLSEEKARRYFRQILQAIDYCHKLFVVHRDLKPENVIFFKKHDIAKLTDFGFSNIFMPGTKLQTSCGSLAYSAPEILLGDSYDAPAVDVWSLGVILYMMVIGKAPFYEANESETLTMILDCKFHIPDHVSPDCQRMIVRDVSKRASLEEIIGDSWVHGNNGPVTVTSIPLSKQVTLAADQHNEIVEKMKLGNIADDDLITQCLESGSYNHISATYYLLAEQVLRHWHKTRQSPSQLSNEEKCRKAMVLKRQSLPQVSISNDIKADIKSVQDLPVNDENEDIDLNLITSKLRYHSSESIYDDVKNSEVDKSCEDNVVSISLPMNKRKPFQKRRVAKVKSTPAFLNQISEERDSDLDDSPRASPRLRRSSRRPLNQVMTRRTSPAQSVIGRQSSSHSSSSEDDAGDLDKKMRRLTTEKSSRRSPKRRSDDEDDEGTCEDNKKCNVLKSVAIAKKRMMCEKDVETRKDNKRTNNEDSQINELSNKNNSGTVEVNNANNVVEHNVCFTRDEEDIETENQLIHNSFIEGCNVKTIADTTCKEETMNEASLRDSIEEIRTTQDNKRESGSKHGAVTVFVRHVGEDVKKNETDNVKEYKQEEFKSEKLQGESENVLVSMEDLSNCNKSLDNDINDIEMVMMKKERELYRPAVRTIFNNPKISRVTSNCCILI